MMGLGIKSDGNGGVDINVQRTWAFKWGPIMAIALFVLMGLGSRIGSEAWAVIMDQGTMKTEIARNAEDISGMRGDFKEILEGQTRLEVLIKQHIGPDGPEGDQ